jgi:hypothetical protein
MAKKKKIKTKNIVKKWQGRSVTPYFGNRTLNVIMKGWMRVKTVTDGDCGPHCFQLATKSSPDIETIEKDGVRRLLTHPIDKNWRKRRIELLSSVDPFLKKRVTNIKTKDKLRQFVMDKTYYLDSDDILLAAKKLGITVVIVNASYRPTGKKASHTSDVLQNTLTICQPVSLAERKMMKNIRNESIMLILNITHPYQHYELLWKDKSDTALYEWSDLPKCIQEDVEACVSIHEEVGGQFGTSAKLPDTYKSDSNFDSDATLPDTSDSDATLPDTSDSDATLPDTSDSDATLPDTSESEYDSDDTIPEKLIRMSKKKELTIIHTFQISTLPSNIYNFLQDLPLTDTVNFLNFTTVATLKTVTFHMKMSIHQPKYTRLLNWEDIKCTAFRLGSLHIKTNCLNPVNNRRYPPQRENQAWKIFVKKYTNFYEYVRALQHGDISRIQNKILWDRILQHLKTLREQTGFKGSFRNHNLDVNILHFKFE